MKGSQRRRCGAWVMGRKARRAGRLRGQSPFCRKWAVRGKTRCDLHGGKSTGPRTPAGKAAALAAGLAGRRARIAELALEGKKINTGHNGGRLRKDGQPMKRRSTTRQQILASLATMAAPNPTSQEAAARAAQAAERRIHEEAIAKEIALRQKLLNLVLRGSDAALVRHPRDPAKRQERIAQGLDALATLRQKWHGPK